MAETKDDDIQIGNKKIGGSTRITLSIKLAIVIISGLFGIISTLATVGYFDIKKRMKDQTEEFAKEKASLEDNLEKALEKEIVVVVKDVEDLEDVVSELKGDVKVVLDRTSGARSTTVTIGSNSPPPPD